MHLVDTSKTSKNETIQPTLRLPHPICLNPRPHQVYFDDVWTIATETIHPFTVIDFTIDTLSVITSCLGRWKKILPSLFLWMRTIIIKAAMWLALGAAERPVYKCRRFLEETTFQKKGTRTTNKDGNKPTTRTRFSCVNQSRLMKQQIRCINKK